MTRTRQKAQVRKGLKALRLPSRIRSLLSEPALIAVRFPAVQAARLSLVAKQWFQLQVNLQVCIGHAAGKSGSLHFADPLRAFQGVLSCRTLASRLALHAIACGCQLLCFYTPMVNCEVFDTRAVMYSLRCLPRSMMRQILCCLG